MAKEIFLISNRIRLNYVLRKLHAELGERIDAGGEMVVEQRDVSKTRPQEERYHAMIGEIAKQSLFHGKPMSTDAWKRLLIDAFKHDTRSDPVLARHWDDFGDAKLVPALNNNGFVSLAESSKKFSVTLASAFIEWLFAYGSENGIRFSR